MFPQASLKEREMLFRITLLDELAMPLDVPERPQRHLADRTVEETALYGSVVTVQENPPDVGSALSVLREVFVRDKSPGGQLVRVPGSEMPMSGIRYHRDLAGVFHRSVLPVFFVVVQRIGHPAVEPEAAPIGTLRNEVTR